VHAGGNPVFAPARRGLGEVLALALAIDHKIRCGPVALAGHFRLAIGQELDIASEYDRYRLVDTAVALWESHLGPRGNFADGVAPYLTGWGLR